MAIIADTNTFQNQSYKLQATLLEDITSSSSIVKIRPPGLKDLGEEPQKNESQSSLGFLRCSVGASSSQGLRLKVLISAGMVSDGIVCILFGVNCLCPTCNKLV